MSGETVIFNDSERPVDTVDSKVKDLVDVPSLPEVGKDPSELNVYIQLPLIMVEEVASESVE